MKYKLNFEAKIINMKHPYNAAVKFANDISREDLDLYLRQTVIVSVEISGVEPTKELTYKLLESMKKATEKENDDIKVIDLTYKNCEVIL